MQENWLEVHRKTEAKYWWFVNKRHIVRRLLARHRPPGNTLLEVGCGGGLFSGQLARAGWHVISADLSPDGAKFAREQGVRHALAFDGSAGWPLAGGIADCFVLLDVLEHLEKPHEALAEAFRVLRPGGVGIVTVPAYQFLFSAWDEYNHHYRRYTARMLSDTAKRAGFHIERSTYWNAITLAPAILLRLKDKLLKKQLTGAEFPRTPALLNAALVGFGRIENAWVARLPLPAGLSVIAVLRKKA